MSIAEAAMASSTAARQRERFTEMRREGKARHRDIAAALGLSEGELIAAFAGLDVDDPVALRAVRLRAPWPQIVAALTPLGEVMALTRNESCVHEKVGVYDHVSADGHVGLVLGGAIDLRVFYMHWAHGFGVSERLADGTLQRSLQFFDAAGLAVHKVFLREGSSVAAYEQLVEGFAAADQAAAMVVKPAPSAALETPDADIDVAAFREQWTAMRDTHEFFGLIKRHGLARPQALRLAPVGFAHGVEPGMAQQLLSLAAQRGVPIMVFVGNRGMIQIHSGPVHKVQVMGPWLNVLDPGFNLHLREDHIAAAWVVRKPTSDGLVNSLELFDAEGNTIAMFFGERKPGRAELCSWRELLDDVTGTAQAGARAC